MNTLELNISCDYRKTANFPNVNKCTTDFWITTALSNITLHITCVIINASSNRQTQKYKSDVFQITISCTRVLISSCSSAALETNAYEDLKPKCNYVLELPSINWNHSFCKTRLFCTTNYRRGIERFTANCIRKLTDSLT